MSSIVDETFLEHGLEVYSFYEDIEKQECFKRVHPKPFKPTNKELWEIFWKYLATCGEIHTKLPTGCSHCFQDRLQERLDWNGGHLVDEVLVE